MARYFRNISPGTIGKRFSKAGYKAESRTDTPAPYPGKIKRAIKGYRLEYVLKGKRF